MHFETRAIHDGQEPDPATGAITTPIYQTSTYVQEAVGVHKGYDYARVGNPTRTALEECIASLEGAAHGRAFSSGLGAATTLMHLLSPGDHVVAVNDVYGGIYRMFTQVYEPKGYRFTFLTPDEISTGLAAHLEERTEFVWLETPTNPALNIVDIAAASEAAHAVGALVVVDNTFATPYLQQPLALGADIVLAFDDEVPRRALRRGRRLRRDEQRRGRRPARPSCRSRSAPCPGRSTPGSCCAASRRLPCAWIATARTHRDRRLPRAASARASVSSTRAAVPSWPPDRSAPDAELRRHGLVPARRTSKRRSTSSPARRSGSSPRASAASRA